MTIPFHYAWFVWSLCSLAIWLVIYLFLDTPTKKKEMLAVSFGTALFGLTEPIFIPSYWMPPSLFNLSSLIHFDIESLIWCFAVGGITVTIYWLLFPSRIVAMQNNTSLRFKLHALIQLAAPIMFCILFYLTPLNSMYDAIISLLVGGIATIICRPDLAKKMIASAFLFLILYFFYFLILTILSPGYVAAVWNLRALSGILIIGIPLEELLFAFSFGFMWSSVYEFIAWKKIRPIKALS